ncbi:MAG: hypothetical protein GXP54_07080 [Deltaproteobacteria bacterium]|nr:hypothetical protein [Deltaproteobacteria bacterium]
MLRKLRFVLAAASCLVIAAPAFSSPRPCGNAGLRMLLPDRRPDRPGTSHERSAFPKVGDHRDFWTYDLSVMPPDNVQIPSVCRAVGDHSAIWVADDQWGSKVTQDDVDKLLKALESDTPRTPGHGIVENNESLFGSSPLYAQGDPDLTILIYDIPDYQNYTFDGFFRAEDMTPFNPQCANNPSLYCSNELGMVHVDSADASSLYKQGVIAHEFEHLIHFGRDPYEENWLDESLAELAMVYSGYHDDQNLAWYVAHPYTSLVKAPPVDYGACLLFGAYLYQRFGAAGVLQLTSSALTGIPSISEFLPQGTSFSAFFGQWAMANALDDPNLDSGEYGYDLVDVPQFAVVELDPPPIERDIQITPTTAVYHTLAPLPDADKYLEIDYSTQGAQVSVLAAFPDAFLVQSVESGNPTQLPPPVLVNPGFVVASNADTTSTAAVTLTLKTLLNNELPDVIPDMIPESIPDSTADSWPDSAPDVASPHDSMIQDAQTSSEPAASEGVIQGPDTTGAQSGGGCSAATEGPSPSPMIPLLLLAILGAVTSVRKRT